MKPDILALGVFPPGMMAALAERFMVHHFVPYPPPDGALSPDVAGRIRAIATEANRGATTNGRGRTAARSSRWTRTDMRGHSGRRDVHVAACGARCPDGRDQARRFEDRFRAVRPMARSLASLSFNPPLTMSLR